MTTKISKWGNSYGIRIPKKIVEELGFSEDTEFDISVSKNKLEIKPQTHNRKIKYSLKKLCDQITPENRHEEFDWGKPMGKEVW